MGAGGNGPRRARKVREPLGAGDNRHGADSRENPRPASEALWARTVNRHRWSGRVYQGAREIHGQGTRQIDPVTSGEGVLREIGGAENRSRQLFSKNTGLCEAERRGIQTDTCPVPEG